MFAGPRAISFQTDTLPPLKPEEVRIQTLCSGISRGTEMTVYRATSPYLEKTFDPEGKRKVQKEAMMKLRELPDRKACVQGVIDYLEQYPELDPGDGVGPLIMRA